jgi:precorrin-2 dehydrogenase / sirohydrochlorin ferrochelatase
MRYYPIQLDVQGRRCLVVGGGGVGTRKVDTLLSCGAQVTVVSPAVTDELRRLFAEGFIRLWERAYSASDLEGVFLVIGATDDEDLNFRISRDAAALNILCNIADRPEKCNFILPAIVQRGDLVLTVSTSGKSPALAKKLRRELEHQFGDEYAVLLRLMGAIRKRLLAEAHAPEVHKPIFEKIVHSDILRWIRDGRRQEVNRLLAEILGEGWSAEALLSEEDDGSGN